MRPLSALEGRILAVSLLLALLLVLTAAVVSANRWAHRRYDEPIAERLDRIARYDRIAAQGGDLERAIDAVKAKNASRFYLKSSSPSLAAADIQQVMQALLEADALRLESMQIAPHKDEGEHRRITLNLRLRGKLANIQHLFYALESTQPYLFIDNMIIQSSVRYNYVPTPGVEPDVIAQFDLSGYALVKKNDAAPRR